MQSFITVNITPEIRDSFTSYITLLEEYVVNFTFELVVKEVKWCFGLFTEKLYEYVYDKHQPYGVHLDECRYRRKVSVEYTYFGSAAMYLNKQVQRSDEVVMDQDMYSVYLNVLSYINDHGRNK